MHFQMKNTLKSNHNHTLKHSLNKKRPTFCSWEDVTHPLKNQSKLITLKKMDDLINQT